MGTSDPTRIDIMFDPYEQRMRGIARHGYVHFDVPFISHIKDNLYTGGCEDGLYLPDNIDHVVSLYPWERYDTRGRILKSYLEIKMYDSEDGIPDENQLARILGWARDCVEDGPTLIHCQAGLNRSSFVAALTSILVGYVNDGNEAVELLREQRSPAVLCNKAFEEFVRNL